MKPLTMLYHGQHKVTFFANKDRIGELLSAGYPIKQIHRAIPALANMSYPVLASYIKRYITRPQHKEETRGIAQFYPSQDNAPLASDATGSLITPQPGFKRQEKPRHQIPVNKPIFEHDPDSVKRRDDLI